MNIRELILQGSTLIAKGTESDTPWLDALVIFGHVSGMRKERLVASMRDPVPDGIDVSFLEMCRKRAGGYPVAYLTGKKEFFGRDFVVNEHVLIPRPETEILVEWVLESVAHHANRRPQPGAGFPLQPLRDPRILDCFTGSGCIPAILALETGLNIDACDISPEALEMAQLNAKLLGTDALVTFYCGDIFEALPSGTAPYGLISANPPYVPHDESQKTLARGWSEPLSALDGGPDGLQLIRRFLSDIEGFLQPEGWLFMEYGDGQTPQILSLLEENNFTEIEIRRDLAGLDRIVRAKFSRYDGGRGLES